MKTQKLIKLSAIIATTSTIALIMSGCNGGGSSTKPNNLAETNISNHHRPKLGNDFFLLQLGSGFDSSSNTVTSSQSCLAAAVNPENITVTNPGGYLHYGDNVSLNHLENALGININGAMGSGVFSNSMQAAYLQNAEDSAYKLNLNYIYQYAGVATFVQGSIGQGKAALTPVAASFAYGGDPIKFRKMCGNSFISQMDAGGLLGFTISLSFNSSIDKQSFEVALGRPIVGISHIGAAIQNAAASSHVNVNMSLSALQLGGDPQNLNNIFGTENPNGNFPFFDCGSVNNKDMVACSKMMNNVIAYGQTLESQVSNPDGSINVQKMYYTNAVTAKYSTLGITSTAPDPSPTVMAAAQKLVKGYNDANFNYQFSKHYMDNLNNYLTVDSLNILDDVKHRLDRQINDIYLNQNYNILECFRGYIPNSCTQIEANVESALAGPSYALSSEDTSLLNYFLSTIYATHLYGYTGMGTDNPTDYQLQSCMFYPVSSPYNAQYVIYCTQGTFFPITSAGLSITQSTLPNGNNQLQINGLQYDAINPLYPSFQPQINYPNALVLNVNPEEPNNFEATNVTVTGGTSFTTSTARLSLFQIPKEEN